MSSERALVLHKPTKVNVSGVALNENMPTCAKDGDQLYWLQVLNHDFLSKM